MDWLLNKLPVELVGFMILVLYTALVALVACAIYDSNKEAQHTPPQELVYCFDDGKEITICKEARICSGETIKN